MSLVQETSGSTSGTSLTLTFPAAVGFSNAVIIACGGYYGGAISDITIGGVAGKFSKQATSDGYNCEIWAELFVTQYEPAEVVITTTAAGIIAYAYEVTSGVAASFYPSVALDKTAGDYAASGAAWTSGSTTETINATEFAIGLGFVMNNSGTITGPGSGWTNEAAITDVIGSGSYPIGAVSGYQNVSSPVSLTYSGTQAVNSGHAGVVATFLLMQTQPAWGGYEFTEHSAYTSVSATFIVPTITAAKTTGLGAVSVWVGLSGLNTVYQTGIDIFANQATFPNQGWATYLPGGGSDWSPTKFPADPGDSITMTAEINSESWLMTLVNNTKGWTYTDVKSFLGINVGSYGVNGNSFWPYYLPTAEVIVEFEATSSSNPEYADYGVITFTNISTTPPISQPPQPLVTVVGTDIGQYPEPFNLGSRSFSMIWVAAS
jgi:hypothetical protein